MTDKEIIIDGVDVSGCSYGEIEKDIFECSCEYNVRSASMFCKDNPNCYFKQLKRKEQEYEELRKYHNKCCEEFENEKQALLEKYNQVSINFYNGDYCNTEHCSLLKAKEQECEELKKEQLEIKKYLGISSKTILERLEELQERRDELSEKNISYEQALDEIESICLKDVHTFTDGTFCRYSSLNTILDIINKAKDGE